MTRRGSRTDRERTTGGILGLALVVALAATGSGCYRWGGGRQAEASGRAGGDGTGAPGPAPQAEVPGEAGWPLLKHDLARTSRCATLGPVKPVEQWHLAVGQALAPLALGVGVLYVGDAGAPCLYAVSTGGKRWWTLGLDQPVCATPALGPDGTVYVATWPVKGPSAPGATDRGAVYAVGASGDVRWSDPVSGGAYASPALTQNGTLYVATFKGELRALTPAGEIPWSRQLGGFRCMSSPALGHDGTVYVGVMGAAEDATRGSLVAVRPSGDPSWRLEGIGDVVGTPAVGDDGTVYVVTYLGTVIAVSPAGGELWRYDLGGATTSSPALGHKGQVHIGLESGRLACIRSDGSLRWTYDAGAAIRGCPVVDGQGTVYCGTAGQGVVALREDGSLLWSLPFGEVVAGAYPVLARDGTLFIGTSEGTLYAFHD